MHWSRVHFLRAQAQISKLIIFVCLNAQLHNDCQRHQAQFFCPRHADVARATHLFLFYRPLAALSLSQQIRSICSTVLTTQASLPEPVSFALPVP